jgi:hypothetical protein
VEQVSIAPAGLFHVCERPTSALEEVGNRVGGAGLESVRC